jgi:NAD(P)-dependent dehydrogenase (short-subunit alcohol dehydrogenase family)
MMLNDFDLTGKKVLITGAGRGIGKGIAFAMAEAGADIGVTSLGGESAVSVAEDVRKLGRRGFGWAADATRVADMEALRDKAFAEMGGVDILVNCLGDAIRGTVSAMPGSELHVLDEKDWHHVVDVNLTQAYVGCHVFGPHLLEKGAAANVINISSFAAIRPGANMVAYASGKAGLTRFTESLALEWAPYRVRVNAIAPGTFPDAYAMSEADWQRRNADAASSVPLGRLGHPREVGLMAVYLASDAASYVTGQTFAIDGGRTLL